MVASKSKGASKGALGALSIEGGSEASGASSVPASLGTKDPSENAVLGADGVEAVGTKDPSAKGATEGAKQGAKRAGKVKRESGAPPMNRRTSAIPMIQGTSKLSRSASRKKPGTRRERRIDRKVSALAVDADRPHRLEFAVELVSPRKGYACRYAEAVARIMERYKVCRTTAAEDMARAYDAIAQRVQALMPSLPARIRDQLESLAHECRQANTPMDRATASATLHRLGRLSGMVEGGEESQARRLTDDALNAAIAAEVAVRIDRMDTAELDDLLKRKQGRALAQASLAIDVTATELVAMPIAGELPSGDAGSEGA